MVATSTLEDFHLSVCAVALTSLFKLDLRNSTITACCFEKTVFQQCDLRGWRYTGQRLVHCQFTETRLDEADLSGCTLTQSHFRDASMRGVRLVSVQATLAQFVGADLSDADCRHGTFDQTVWNDARVERAAFGGSRFRYSTLQKITAHGADFRETDLACCDFSRARLDGADFRDARFARTCFHRATLDDASWSNKDGFIEADAELYAAESWSEQYHPVA